jgi:hypothetical protein
MHGPMNAKFSPSLVYVENCATVFDQQNQAFRTLCSEKQNYDFDMFRPFRVSWMFNPFILSPFDFPSLLRRYNFVLENIFSHLPPFSILRVLLEKSGQSKAKGSLSFSDKIQRSQQHVRKVTSETQNTDMTKDAGIWNLLPFGHYTSTAVGG